ncbi:MAG: PTS sugar transporter subunit IIA [Tissierellales bacterium]|nr:PTS sugar transporter subunit IIA [Tissierellales bacterium]
MSNEIVIGSDVVEVKIAETDRKRLLQYMADKLEKQGYVKSTYAEAIIQREEKFSTGLQLESFGVAIPHTDAIHVNQSTISVATLENPIDFCEMGNPSQKVPVRIVLMLAMKEGREQVALLTKIMEMVQNNALLEQIYNANQEELVQLLNQNLA